MSCDYHVVVVYTAQELVLEVLQALTSDTKIVKESIQKGETSWSYRLFYHTLTPPEI